MNIFLKIFCISIVCVLLGYFFCHLYNRNQKKEEFVLHQDNPDMQNHSKKKIMIFTSSGGRGHVSATQAITEYCGDLYNIEVVYALREILGPVDFIYTITGGRYHSEELYNYCITHNYTWAVPIMVWFGEWFFWLRAKKITQLIEDYLVAHKPDLLISVIPMINGVALKAAESLSIPFWVIPTDLDAQKFAHQIDNPTYKKFFFNVAYDDNLIKNSFSFAHIADTHLTYAGFPVRKAFLKEYDTHVLKKEYAIPEGKPVVMLLMGGLGSRDTLKFAKELTQVQHSMHALICIGKSEELRPELELIVKNEYVTFSIIGFTERIAELMAISDLLITKSGGLSVNEALYMDVPMILDATSSGLVWERLNRIFVAEHNFGYVLKDKKDLRVVVEDVLRNPEKLTKWKHSIQQLNKKNPQIEMLKIIRDLVIL